MSKPYPHLAILLVVPTLLVGANGTAARADWQTRVPYAEGVLLLHWRHIYEGKDTVDRLEIKPTQASSTVFIVSGQPVFDAKKRMVAFPYCADDGCESKIDLIDLIERKRLPAITLNYNGQFYLVRSANRKEDGPARIHAGVSKASSGFCGPARHGANFLRGTAAPPRVDVVCASGKRPASS